MTPLQILVVMEQRQSRRLEKEEAMCRVAKNRYNACKANYEAANRYFRVSEFALKDQHEAAFEKIEGKVLDVHDRFSYLMENYQISSAHAQTEKVCQEKEEETQAAFFSLKKSEEKIKDTYQRLEKFRKMIEELKEDLHEQSIAVEDDELDDHASLRYFKGVQ